MEGLLVADRERDKCRKLMTRLKGFLLENERKNSPRLQVYIGIFCNSGTHRSVALTQRLNLTLPSVFGVVCVSVLRCFDSAFVFV